MDAERRERQALAGEVAELRERAGRAEGEVSALQGAVARERDQAVRERQAREAAEAELGMWMAGSPWKRALRALLYRRGQP